MGRIGTGYISRKAQEVIDKYPAKFSTDFKKNKQGLAEISEIPSKKLRNKLAGKILRLEKAKEQE